MQDLNDFYLLSKNLNKIKEGELRFCFHEKGLSISYYIPNDSWTWIITIPREELVIQNKQLIYAAMRELQTKLKEHINGV